MEEGKKKKKTAFFPHSVSTVVLSGKSQLTVYGCRKIAEYSPNRLCLELSDGVLSVAGENLLCASFSAGVLTVVGCFFGVAFEEDETEELR